MNSNNTTSIEEIKSLIKSNITALGEGEIEIESKLWTDLGKLLDQAYSQGVTDGRKQAFSEVNSATEAVDLANIKQKSFNSKRFMKLANEVNDILEKEELTKLSSMKEKGMK